MVWGIILTTSGPGRARRAAGTGKEVAIAAGSIALDSAVPTQRQSGRNKYPISLFSHSPILPGSPCPPLPWLAWLKAGGQR